MSVFGLVLVTQCKRSGDCDSNRYGSRLRDAVAGKFAAWTNGFRTVVTFPLP